MPHSLSRSRDKIRAVSLEYSAVRVSLDWLLSAETEDIHGIAKTGGNADPHRGAMYQAHENIAATYFLRMFSSFEMVVKSYWRSLPGNAGGNPDVIDAINDVGFYLHISYDTIDQAQRIRVLRNDLIHDWNRARVITVDLPSEMNRLMKFLDCLPPAWP